MVDSVNNVGTINIRPPQNFEKYSYEVEIDGKKQTAHVDITPNGQVTIKIGKGKNAQTIVTDRKGLMEFNKNYMPKQIIYNTKPEEQPNEQKQVYSGKLAQIMRNIALANMMISNSNNLTQQAMQDNFTAMQMHQQAMDMHNMAVQMSTPGMGMI